MGSLTADTITDEQIRELRARSTDDETRDLCELALRPTDRNARQVYGDRHIANTRKARSRCASKINALNAPDIFADLFKEDLTADTITDEDIRVHLLRHADVDVRTCARLAIGAMNEDRRQAARARCAEILNARAAK